MSEVITPPIIGAAMRFMTSARVWFLGDHMIGTSPNRIAQMVMIFGRMRCTAPSITASWRSFIEFMRPAARNFIPGMIQVKQHNNSRFGIEARQPNQADPHGDAHVIAQQIKLVPPWSRGAERNFTGPPPQRAWLSRLERPSTNPNFYAEFT